MKLVDWIILSIVILVFIGIVILLVLTRDKGCCGCGKSDCPMKKIKRKKL